MHDREIQAGVGQSALLYLWLGVRIPNSCDAPILCPIPTIGRGICSRNRLIMYKRSREWSNQDAGQGESQSHSPSIDSSKDGSYGHRPVKARLESRFLLGVISAQPISTGFDIRVSRNDQAIRPTKVHSIPERPQQINHKEDQALGHCINLPWESHSREPQ